MPAGGQTSTAPRSPVVHGRMSCWPPRGRHPDDRNAHENQWHALRSTGCHHHDAFNRETQQCSPSPCRRDTAIPRRRRHGQSLWLGVCGLRRPARWLRLAVPAGGATGAQSGHCSFDTWIVIRCTEGRRQTAQSIVQAVCGMGLASKTFDPPTMHAVRSRTGNEPDNLALGDARWEAGHQHGQRVVRDLRAS